MDKKISQKQRIIAEALGANRIIKVSKRKLGGPIAWLDLINSLQYRFVSTGGRPSDPNWDTKRLVPFRRKVWNYLTRTAKHASVWGPKVGPAQIAGIMIEKILMRSSESYAEPKVMVKVHEFFPGVLRYFSSIGSNSSICGTVSLRMEIKYEPKLELQKMSASFAQSKIVNYTAEYLDQTESIGVVK